MTGVEELSFLLAGTEGLQIKSRFGRRGRKKGVSGGREKGAITDDDGL